ncbi:MAG TPA: hypothetical protein VKR29_08415 [Candidatus Binataceae bacterium]|nr:hypothetical protein [Candidatus Binataceae bacterium]
MPAVATAQNQSNRSVPSAAQLPPSDKNDFKNTWMGTTSVEVEKHFGRPTKTEPLKDTGGTRYYYRETRPYHYVFEFSAKGRVTNAAIVD